MSLVTILKKHTKQKPDQIVYTFLDHNPATTLTFSQLDQQANNIAVELIKQGAKNGDRAIIALSQGLDYLTAFWGCLYASVIAVPVFPPINAKHMQRTVSITQDAQAKIILGNSDAITTFKDIQDASSQAILNDIVYIDIAAIPVSNSSKSLSLPEAEDIAFLQYTSGSTGAPKGVIVKHKNLLVNLYMLQIGFAMDDTSRLISWLPLFHDMGLIGNALQAVFLGAQLYLMTPLNFIKNPLVWLEAISKYQGTHVFAPNFAYDLCIAEASKIKEQSLNLASLKYLANGAEPVRASTIRHFSETFKKYGFNPTTWAPGYGMAEATLFITQGATQAGIVAEDIDADSLTKGKAILVNASTAKINKTISLGKFNINQELIIVNPETLCIQDVRSIGEIWIKGPHICAGYWEKPAISKEIFAAYTKDTQSGPWLRTGDLGYLNEQSDLYIVSRYKDLIILHGKNYAPQDFETTVMECCIIIKHNSVIAFSIDNTQEEELIIVAQLAETITLTQSIELKKNIKKCLLAEHGVTAHKIIFVERGSLPLTTSGKLQRQLCKQNYLSNTLSLLQLS